MVINYLQENGEIAIQLLTEGKIRKHLLDAIRNTESGDTIHLGMFYLSESEVVEDLLHASNRGVTVQVILDPNETVFGRENIGIPNRPVVKEIQEYGNENITIKWYNTSEEQYHSKLILLKQKEKSTLIGGSANFTRRSLNDFNLETNVKIVAPSSSKLISDVSAYFDKIWHNKDGTYTVGVNTYLNDYPEYKKYLFRLQKRTGLTTF